MLGNIEQNVINAINAPTEFLLGTPLINTGPTATLGGSATNGQVPVTIYEGTEALVNASVGTGSPVPLLVDTGSTGLVIPFQKVGGVLGLLQLGLPTGAGVSGYSGGLDYAYLTYNASVNFGGGLATSPTAVDVELFAWPTSIQSALTNGVSFQSFFASDGASGVLGVGPNSGGPGPSIATQALPGSFGDGVLINETNPTNPYIQFGSQTAIQTSLGGQNPIATLTGAPITQLDVSVNDKTAQLLPAEIDSGGVEGTLPFTPSTGDSLYSYNYGTTYSPTPADGVMNTGALIFQENPVYIDYSGSSGEGTTYIY